jgi:plasmid maintenance system antidote protein VapI
MKLEWTQRFIKLVRQHKGERSEVEYAQYLQIPRATLQNILRGEQSISYHHVEQLLRRLGLCHCAVVGLECHHDTGASQNGIPT